MNIYPAEIEDVLLAHPRVTDVAVIGMASAADPNFDLAFQSAS